MINWGILLFLVFIVPFGLGMIPVKYMHKAQQSLTMIYICGWFLSFAIFEVVAIPFIVLKRSFSELVVTYSVILGLALFFSLWRAKKVLVQCCKPDLKKVGMTWLEKIGWCIAILCIAAQVFAAIFLEYYDGDDSYYMAQAVIAIDYDVMYLRDAYTGYEFGFDIRHALSPVPIYIAWLSKLSGIHVLTVAHSVLAPVWLILMYCVYGEIGRKLLEKHRKYQPLFMILVAFWLSFGNISIYTSETFAMNRIWQGKGIMAGIIIPLLYLCLLYLGESKVSKGIWILFVLAIISSGFATSTSLMLVPTLIGAASLLMAYRKKSIVWGIKMMLCCLPCALLGICYVILS